MPIAANARKWQITGLASGVVRVEARAWGKSESWSWFELNVEPGFYQFLTPDKKKFIEDLAKAGKAMAKQYGYPLSAMLACACSESGYGSSEIYKKTNCPFNLQRPAAWSYPNCETATSDTKGKFGSNDAQPAPFLHCQGSERCRAPVVRVDCVLPGSGRQTGAERRKLGAAGFPHESASVRVQSVSCSVRRLQEVGDREIWRAVGPVRTGPFRLTQVRGDLLPIFPVIYNKCLN